MPIDYAYALDMLGAFAGGGMVGMFATLWIIFPE